jgi:hypothetical protein
VLAVLALSALAATGPHSLHPLTPRTYSCSRYTVRVKNSEGTSVRAYASTSCPQYTSVSGGSVASFSYKDGYISCRASFVLCILAIFLWVSFGILPLLFPQRIFLLLLGTALQLAKLFTNPTRTTLYQCIPSKHGLLVTLRDIEANVT